MTTQIEKIDDRESRDFFQKNGFFDISELSLLLELVRHTLLSVATIGCFVGHRSILVQFYVTEISKKIMIHKMWDKKIPKNAHFHQENKLF